MGNFGFLNEALIFHFIFFFSLSPRMQKQFIKGPPVIRLQLVNKCANRRFYRIVLQNANYEPTDPIIEDLGTFDPMPNRDNAIVGGINFERIKHYMGNGIIVRPHVLQILGMLMI